jgi:hypothetical protein
MAVTYQPQHRQERDGVEHRVAQPRVGAIEGEEHARDRGEEDGQGESTSQEVRRDPADDLQDDVEPHQAGRNGEQQRQGKEGGGLHFARQGLSKSLEVVPPREVAVQDVLGGLVPEALRDESDVRVNRRTAAGDAAEVVRDARRPGDWVVVR